MAAKWVILCEINRLHFCCKALRFLQQKCNAYWLCYVILIVYHNYTTPWVLWCAFLRLCMMLTSKEPFQFFPTSWISCWKGSHSRAHTPRVVFLLRHVYPLRLWEKNTVFFNPYPYHLCSCGHRSMDLVCFSDLGLSVKWSSKKTKYYCGPIFFGNGHSTTARAVSCVRASRKLTLVA